MKFKLVAMLSLFVMTFNVVGCSNEITNEKTSKAETVSVLNSLEEKANEVLVTDEFVTFVDGTGKEKTIKKNKQRVVSLYTSLTSLWCEAGGELVGYIKVKGSENQLPDFVLNNENIAIVGKSSSVKNISVEAVIEQKPDLVILGSAMSQPTLAKNFESVGIDCIVVDYEGIEDYLKWFKVFCSINNKEDLYNTVAKKTLDEVYSAISKVPTENNPTVLCLFAEGNSLKVNLPSSNVGKILEDMGGKNIFGDSNDGQSRIDLNMESVLELNPDIIIVQQKDSEGSSQKLIKDLYENSSAFNSLDAVKEGKVFYLEPSLFHYKANSRFGETYNSLGKILYPDLF